MKKFKLIKLLLGGSLASVAAVAGVASCGTSNVSTDFQLKNAAAPDEPNNNPTILVPSLVNYPLQDATNKVIHYVQNQKNISWVNYPLVQSQDASTQSYTFLVKFKMASNIYTKLVTTTPTTIHFGKENSPFILNPSQILPSKISPAMINPAVTELPLNTAIKDVVTFFNNGHYAVKHIELDTYSFNFDSYTFKVNFSKITNLKETYTELVTVNAFGIHLGGPNAPFSLSPNVMY